MTSRDFCYWLQGYFEINSADRPIEAITPEKADMIRRHLALVFKHEIDPSIPNHTGVLQAIHSPT